MRKRRREIGFIIMYNQRSLAFSLILLCSACKVNSQDQTAGDINELAHVGDPSSTETMTRLLYDRLGKISSAIVPEIMKNFDFCIKNASVNFFYEYFLIKLFV